MAKSNFFLVEDSVATAAKLWSGGRGLLTAWDSNWNSGTVTFQVSPDGTNFVGVGTSGTLSANGSLVIEAPSGYTVKAVITGSPTALYVKLTSL